MKKFSFVIFVFLALFLSCSKTTEEASQGIKLEQSPPSEISQAPCKKVAGKYLKAFSEAYKAFLVDEEVPIDLRKIENYDVSFKEEAEGYVVDFIAHRTEQEKIGQQGGGSSLGKDVTYILSKSHYVLTSRRYHK